MGPIGPMRCTSVWQRNYYEHALATLARADVLVSWNFRHMVNWRRIRACNEVNRQNGYSAIDIRTPEEIVHD